MIKPHSAYSHHFWIPHRQTTPHQMVVIKLKTNSNGEIKVCKGFKWLCELQSVHPSECGLGFLNNYSPSLNYIHPFLPSISIYKRDMAGHTLLPNYCGGEPVQEHLTMVLYALSLTYRPPLPPNSTIH